MGVILRVELHLQVHATAREGGWTGIGHGVCPQTIFVSYDLNDVRCSFEDALLSSDPHPVMTQILARFVLNLRPHTRNVR